MTVYSNIFFNVKMGRGQKKYKSSEKPKQSHKQVPIKIKRQIIKLKYEGWTNGELAKWYGLSQSTVSTIYNEKGKDTVDAADLDHAGEEEIVLGQVE